MSVENDDEFNHNDVVEKLKKYDKIGYKMKPVADFIFSPHVSPAI